MVEPRQDLLTDWVQVMGDEARPDDNGLVVITRGTARLAQYALRIKNAADDYSRNYGVAERELTAVLGSS